MAYTAVDDPGLYFNTVLWTGTGSDQDVTGVGFASDLIWLKERSHADYHFANDSVRGKGSNSHYYNLSPNDTGSESDQVNGINTIGSDGFSITTRGEMNETDHTYVAWCWKGGTTGAGTTTGSGTGKAYSYSVSTTAGISITKWLGNGSSGHTIPHNLGTTPHLVIMKNRDVGITWIV